MKKNSHITGFYFETLLLVAVFIAILLVLTQVFGLSRAMSGRAEILTNAVSLAQNGAEAVSAAGSAEEAAALLDQGGNVRLTETGLEAGYDLNMAPAAEAPALRMEITWAPDGDGLVYSTVTVYHGADPVYALDTAVYTGEVGA